MTTKGIGIIGLGTIAAVHAGAIKGLKAVVSLGI